MVRSRTALFAGWYSTIRSAGLIRYDVSPLSYIPVLWTNGLTLLLVQHRFVEGTLVKFGNAAAGFTEVEMGYKEITDINTVAKAFIGDYLRGF